MTDEPDLETEIEESTLSPALKTYLLEQGMPKEMLSTIYEVDFEVYRRQVEDQLSDLENTARSLMGMYTRVVDLMRDHHMHLYVMNNKITYVSFKKQEIGFKTQ